MTGISSYSTTASENVQANTGIDWDEGMAPGQVNNSARQNMADIRAAFDDLIWFQYGIGSKTATHAYASATSTTITGADVTAVYHTGRRVKAVGATTGTIYGSITASSYAGSITTIIYAWDSGSLASELLTLYLSQVPVTGNPVGISGRNRLINGDFRINQRGYAAAVTLAAGTYAHDRWKAGSGGGDYSFTQNKSDTGITIASSKSLMQIVEDTNVEGGAYTLSWSGTAQGRIAVSGAATSGSYLASPITVVAAGAGQTITVEFNAGTLGKVQLEPGLNQTVFERLDFATQLTRCQRYYSKSYDISIAPGATTSVNQFIGPIIAGAGIGQGPKFPVSMRTAPSILAWDAVGSANLWNDSNGLGTFTPTFSNVGTSGISHVSGGSAVGGYGYFGHWTATAEL